MLRNRLPWFKNESDLQSLRRLAEQTGIRSDTLRKAAQDGRLEAEKRGRFWFSSRAAINRAVLRGKIRG